MLWNTGSGTSKLATWNTDKWAKVTTVGCSHYLLPENAGIVLEYGDLKKVLTNDFCSPQTNPGFSNLPVVGNRFCDMPEWQINWPGWMET